MSANLESIKNRIRALAAKTVENGCTEAEALSAMEMVGKLLNQYNLSMTQVELEAEEYKTHNIDTGRKQRHAVYFCLSAVAKFTSTKVWLNRTRTGLKYSFFGQESDVLMAKYLYSLIVTAIDSETSRFKKSDSWIFATNRKGASTSFQMGMVTRISQRLKQMAFENSKELNNARGNNSLVLLKNQLVENAYNDQIGIKMRKETATSRTTDGYAYYAGKAAGDKVNLTRPVNQGAGMAAIGRQ